MGSVLMALRSGTRRDWRALVALALLLGLMGGVAITVAAGARRTDTAFPRLLRASRASDLYVSPAGSGFQGDYFAALRDLPEVASSATAAYLDMVTAGPAGRPGPPVLAQASPDGAVGVRRDRVKLLAGKFFDPADPHAVMIDQRLAAAAGLRPGSTLRLIGYPQDRLGDRIAGRFDRLEFRVSAIVVFDDQVLGGLTARRRQPRVLLSPAFARTPRALSYSPGGGTAAVSLRPGATVRGFTRDAMLLAARQQVAPVFVVRRATDFAATRRAIQPEAAALAATAALAAAIALVLTAQLPSRQLFLSAAEFPALRAVGMSPRQLTAASLARAGAVTVAGGMLAAALAIAASPLMPIGPARLAEPRPGLEANLAILGAGLAAVAVLPLLLVGPAAWRAARPAGHRPGEAAPPGLVRTPRLASALTLAGSVAGGIGVRMAFDPGRGRTAVPVRSALIGTAVAVAAVAAAMVFASSLLGLVGTPHRYGQNWAQQLDLQEAGEPISAAGPVLARTPGLSEYASGNYGQVSIRGTAVPAIGIDQVRGPEFLTMLAGRAPAGPAEIALGAQTMRALGEHLGQIVPVTTDGRTRPMRITGTVVLPAFSRGSLPATNLGSGAVVAAPVLSVPDPPDCSAAQTCFQFFLLRYRPGSSLAAAAASLRRAVAARGCPPDACVVTTDQRPTGIVDDASVRDTPVVLGAVLGLLAVGTLAHVLLTGVRRRRRDLALLKTLGLDRRQLLAVVIWQACAMTGAAVAVGLPLGVVAGRWAWAWFAGSAGAGGGADIPLLLVLSVIPAALIAAVLIAAGPARAAARVRPAAVLRAE
ncbi:MAG TPA: FtsX-like permease family protein [Streptosporangiaceae bacterium]